MGEYSGHNYCNSDQEEWIILQGSRPRVAIGKKPHGSIYDLP